MTHVTVFRLYSCTYLLPIINGYRLLGYRLTLCEDCIKKGALVFVRDSKTLPGGSSGSNGALLRQSVQSISPVQSMASNGPRWSPDIMLITTDLGYS